MSADPAVIRAAATVAAVEPYVDEVAAAAAVERVTSRTRSRNMVTDYLLAHPAALADGGSGAPDAVARMIEELIVAGVEGLARPRCLDCGEEKRLIRNVEGGRVCNRCVKRRRPKEPCSACGQLAACARRDEQGRAVCNRCHKRD